VWGFDPLSAGLAFVTMGLASILAGRLAPRLIGRSSARTILASGLVIQAAGTATLVGLTATSSSLAVFLTGTAMAGFGHITSVVAFRSVAASGLPHREQGLAAGLSTAAQQAAPLSGGRSSSPWSPQAATASARPAAAPRKLRSTERATP